MGYTNDGGHIWYCNLMDIGIGQHIASIDFPNSSQGWAVGGGKIFNTSNGGNHWEINDNGTGGNFRSVSFANDSTGWVIGGGNQLVQLLKTTSAGREWEKIQVDIESDIYSLAAINESRLYISGADGAIYFSPEGGDLWLEQTSGTQFDLKKIYFISEQTGWAVGGDEENGVILHTTNLGMTWSGQDFESATNLTGISFVNDSTGWISANEGALLKTTNAGGIWTNQSIGSISDLNDVDFISETTGWVITLKKIYKTTDGGDNWTRQLEVQSNKSFRAIDFISEQEGWVVGNWGEIRHTSDGGESWELEESGINSILTDLCFSASGSGWIVGSQGIILSNDPASVITIVNETEIVNNFTLYQNYPNPFNPATKIRYSIPTGEKVELKIFDLLGREINTLVNEYKPAGYYEAEFDAGSLSSGEYLYRLTTGDYSETKKMLYLK